MRLIKGFQILNHPVKLLRQQFFRSLKVSISYRKIKIQVSRMTRTLSAEGSVLYFSLANVQEFYKKVGIVIIQHNYIRMCCWSIHQENI